nr:HD domain-containing protein [Streptomyces sulfonofaciens]
MSAHGGRRRVPAGGRRRARVPGAAVAGAVNRATGGAAAPVLAGLYGAAALVAAAAAVGTALHGAQERGTALAFGVLIAAGEAARCGRAGDREPAPLAVAGALAYALLGHEAGRATHQDPAQVVTVVLAAVLAGSVPHIAAGRGPHPDHVVRRVLTVAFAAVCAHPLRSAGPTGEDPEQGATQVLLIALLLAATVLCDAVLAAALACVRGGRPFERLLRDEVRARRGLGSALAATGAAMSLGVAVAGLWALPLFSLPLMLTQLSYRRHAAVRALYLQTVASLARATEIAGCTPRGHARRVAALSRAIGRDLGLGRHDLTVLEYAALMHDTGQLSLLDPVPAGATASLPADEQRRIARLGGAVVRRTGVDAAVAEAVEQQAAPYREQPLAARVVRVANAYDEMAREGGPAGPLAALERLRLAGGDYQPEIVEALARVLARDGVPTADAAPVGEGAAARDGAPARDG